MKLCSCLLVTLITVIPGRVLALSVVDCEPGSETKVEVTKGPIEEGPFKFSDQVNFQSPSLNPACQAVVGEAVKGCERQKKDYLVKEILLPATLKTETRNPAANEYYRICTATLTCVICKKRNPPGPSSFDPALLEPFVVLND